MNSSEILSKFPMKVSLTQEMIDRGRNDILDIRNCTGAQLLKSIFPNNEIRWSNVSGTIYCKSIWINVSARFASNNELAFMLNVVKPCEIILTAKIELDLN